MGIKSTKVNKIDLLRSSFANAASQYTQGKKKKDNPNLSWDEGQFTNKYYCLQEWEILTVKAVPIKQNSVRHCFSRNFLSGSYDLKRPIYTVKPRMSALQLLADPDVLTDSLRCKLKYQKKHYR